MNFAFTEDQLALKEGMASFFAAEIPAERLRRLRAGTDSFRR